MRKPHILPHLLLFSVLLVVLVVQSRAAHAADTATKPNIIWIMADDLGYGDLGCYGQKHIQTPRIDRMAAEGMRFTNAYAGTTVCAPSRCVLMTGYHTGHCHVRGNAGGNMSIQALRPQDVTVAEVLKKAGYATALCGKWGLSDEDTTGQPNDKGFDFFYGYMNQVHAHNYYPEFLWRNKTKDPLRNVVHKVEGRYGGFTGGWATKRVDYSHDLLMHEATQWIEAQAKDKSKPFFLYLSLTIPHANNEGTRGTKNGQEVPDNGIYADKNWPEPDKGQAAMVTRMDTHVGELLDQLHRLGVANNTVVFFTSDNGPHHEGGNNPEFFDANGPLRGYKRDLYEGGIRVPMIAWWPGHVRAGATDDTVWGFQDLLATAADLAGVSDHVPKDTDGLSVVSVLNGKPAPAFRDRVMYWEFYEQGGKQAVRQGKWKAVRLGGINSDSPIELYDLSGDIGETKNVAASHSDIVAHMSKLMAEQHTDHPNWQARGKK